MNSIFYKQGLSKTTTFATLATVVVILGFPLKAKAEWQYIGDGEEGPIYLNDQSVYVKNDLRTAEVRYKGFGRAIFVVNCNTDNYSIQTNGGRDHGYAAPGTVAGVVLAEVCDRYK